MFRIRITGPAAWSQQYKTGKLRHSVTTWISIYLIGGKVCHTQLSSLLGTSTSIYCYNALLPPGVNLFLFHPHTPEMHGCECHFFQKFTFRIVSRDIILSSRQVILRESTQWEKVHSNRHIQVLLLEHS